MQSASRSIFYEAPYIHGISPDHLFLFSKLLSQICNCWDFFSRLGYRYTLWGHWFYYAMGVTGYYFSWQCYMLHVTPIYCLWQFMVFWVSSGRFIVYGLLGWWCVVVGPNNFSVAWLSLNNLQHMVQSGKSMVYWSRRLHASPLLHTPQGHYQWLKFARPLGQVFDKYCVSNG